MSKQIERVIDEFTKQAENFNQYQMMFSKEEYNKFTIDNIHFQGTEKVLEVAAGTCAFGRSVAPYVEHVTELDVTSAMLEVGKSEAQKECIDNVSFVIGVAEALPFQDNTFDCVMSRLAFHHFEAIDKAYKEMVRVLKPGGKIVIVDMEARDEELRERADELETQRDPSHVRCVSREEFKQLTDHYQTTITFCETIKMPVSLSAWLDLTRVVEPTRTHITKAMEEDVEGRGPTGFEPYLQDDAIHFYHKWMLIVAEKE